MGGSEKKLISVVVPVFNEIEVIGDFHKRLTTVLKNLPFKSEVLYINDGSTDGTLNYLKNLKGHNIFIIDLSRNFGKEIAMTAGLDHAIGDFVIVIDADLQDPPELIPEMVKKGCEGNDVVYCRRISRNGETLIKKGTAKVFYRAIQFLSIVKIPEDVGDFRLLSRRAVDALKLLREQHRFMKGLFAWIGYKQIAIDYTRDQRFAGKSKWNYWRLWNFALEGITSFSIVPLKMATYLGCLFSLSSIFYAFFIIYKTLYFGEVVKGYPSLMVVILFLGGIQLAFIGLIGEYLGRMFNETKNRPLYLVSEIINKNGKN